MPPRSPAERHSEFPLSAQPQAVLTHHAPILSHGGGYQARTIGRARLSAWRPLRSPLGRRLAIENTSHGLGSGLGRGLFGRMALHRALDAGGAAIDFPLIGIWRVAVAADFNSKGLIGHPANIPSGPSRSPAGYWPGLTPSGWICSAQWPDLEKRHPIGNQTFYRMLM
jgi:hypothetical protein